MKNTIKRIEKKLRVIAPLVCAIVLLGGCKTRLIDYTLISSKNVDLTRIATFTKGSARATGRDEMYLIVIIPTKAKIDVKEALDQAIQSVPGAVALVDGVIYHEFDYYILGAYEAFMVEGTPLIDPSLPGAKQAMGSRYMIGVATSRATQADFEQVDAQTFQAVKRYIVTKDNKHLEKLLAAHAS